MSESQLQIEEFKSPTNINPVKIFIFLVILVGIQSILEIIVKTIFSLVVGEEVFRSRMLNMCGAIWTGNMNYIDWFFKPDFSCDSYSFTHTSAFGFLLITITLSYIVFKFLSNFVFKNDDKTYFKWLEKKKLFPYLTLNIFLVFIVAFVKSDIIGFSPKDTLWIFDNLSILIIHCLTLFLLFKKK
jgi:hypothetical protein